MKKSAHIIASILGLSMLFSCARQEIENKPNTKFYASFENQTSKTELAENGTDVLWSPEDEINLFYYGIPLKYVAKNTTPSASTIFSSKESIFFAPMEDTKTYIYAVYPYSAENTEENNVITLDIPSEHKGISGTFEQGHFPCVARTQNTELRFRNVCGGICFTVSRTYIKEIQVTSTAGKALAGKASIEFDESGLPSVTSVSSGISTVTLTPENKTGFFIPGEKYYLPIIPTDEATDFEIKYIAPTTFATASIKGEIKRNIFASILEGDKELVFIISASGISLNKSDILLSPLGSETLVATIEPEEATDKAVIWSSSDESVATVDENGVVTACDVTGNCVITARLAQNQNLFANCNVTVYQGVTSVTVEPSELTLYNGEAQQLSATILPDNASEKGINWSSSDETVATVDENGNITTVSKGTCQIIATSKDNAEVSDTCSLTVNQNVTSMTISQSALEMFVGDNATLTAEVFPENADDKSVEWTSSNTDVATVDKDGNIQALSDGTVSITVKSVLNPSIYKVCNITITAGINLSAKGTANCYIASTSGWHKFNGTVKGGSGTPLATPTTAEVLWEFIDIYYTAITEKELISDIRYKNGEVYFKIPDPVVNGNAVIAVKNDSGIIWSWHIWVLDGYDPEASAVQYKNGAGLVMDRNLGCCDNSVGSLASTGLLYQWGRKDPFPTYFANGLGKITTLKTWPIVASDATIGTVEYAIAHPTTFIKACSNGDWLYSSSKSNYLGTDRWNDSKKTDYDPCPYGWKVAKGSPSLWETATGVGLDGEKLSWGNKGMDCEGIFTEEGTPCWYSATGRYLGDSGGCNAIDSQIYIWTSNHPSNLKYAIIFYRNSSSKEYYPVYSSDKVADGYAVRCVKQQ